MFQKRIMHCSVIAITAFFLMAVASAPAAIVTDNLLLHYDAGDADGDGTPGVGTTAVWTNKAPTGATHNGTLVGSVVWGGTGTPGDPYLLHVVQTPPYAYPSPAQGYVKVDNTTGPGDLSRTVYTYETWAEIVGPGTGEGNSSMFYENATLMGHNGTGYVGNGGIHYTLTGSWQAPADCLYGGNAIPDEKPLPGSSGLIADGTLHHIVLTRAGDGPNDTAWYLDGTPMGTLQTPSSTDIDGDTWGGIDFIIGARRRGWQYYDMAASADFAQVRVYGDVLTPAEVLQNFNTGLTEVPEPGTLALLATGLIGLLAYGWRKRK